MRLRDPNNVGSTVQTDPTLLPYASGVAEQNVGMLECWELLVSIFAQQLLARRNDTL